MHQFTVGHVGFAGWVVLRCGFVGSSLSIGNLLSAL